MISFCNALAQHPLAIASSRTPWLLFKYGTDAFGLHRLLIASLSMPRLTCWWQVFLMNFSKMKQQKHLGCNRLHLGLCPVSPMLWSRGKRCTLPLVFLKHLGLI